MEKSPPGNQHLWGGCGVGVNSKFILLGVEENVQICKKKTIIFHNSPPHGLMLCKAVWASIHFAKFL